MDSKWKAFIGIFAVALVVSGVVGAAIGFNGSADFTKSEFRVVVTGSMEGPIQENYQIQTIKTGSLVAIHRLDYSEMGSVNIGDVIEFNDSHYDQPVIHRVVEIRDNGFTTHGDANHESNVEFPSFADVRGKVVNVNYPAGQAVMFIKNNLFALILMIVLLVIMMEAISYLLKIRKEGESNG